MDMKRFETMLGLSGADLALWPERAARDARLLLARSPEARKLHQAMEWVESALAASRPKADSASVARVISGALGTIRLLPPPMSFMDRLRSFLVVPSLPRLAFGVTAAAAGFVIGIVIGAPGNTQAAAETGIPVITTASASDVLF